MEELEGTLEDVGKILVRRKYREKRREQEGMGWFRYPKEAVHGNHHEAPEAE